MKIKPVARTLAVSGLGAALIIIVALLVVQQIRIGRISRQFSETTENLIGELRTGNESSAELKQNVITLASEVNDILKALRLPASSVRFSSSQEIDESDGTNAGIYLQAVDTLVEAWNTEIETSTLESLAVWLEESAFPMAPYSLDRSAGPAISLLINDRPGFLIGYDDESGYRISAATGTETAIAGADITSARNEVASFVSAHTTKVQELYRDYVSLNDSLLTLFATPAVRDFLLERQLSVGISERTIGMVAVQAYDIVRKGRVLFSVYAVPDKGNIAVGDRQVEGAKDVLQAAEAYLSSIDIRSPEEVRISEQLATMRELLKDEGFVNFIGSRGLRLIDSRREDSDYFYFDLIDSDNSRIGAFGVQKFLGEIYLVDHEDVPVRSLKELTGADVKKN